MKKLAFLVAFLVLAGLALLAGKLATSVEAGSTHTQWGTVTWGSCVSDGLQCGTDNGTQTGSATCVTGGDKNECSLGTWVNTTYTYTDPICPTGYELQNSGNWDQRCHRIAHCNGGDCAPEHQEPDSCPNGYTQYDADCRKVAVEGHMGNPDVKTNFSQPCHTGIIQYDSCNPCWSMSNHLWSGG